MHREALDRCGMRKTTDGDKAHKTNGRITIYTTGRKLLLTGNELFGQSWTNSGPFDIVVLPIFGENLEMHITKTIWFPQ